MTIARRALYLILLLLVVALVAAIGYHLATRPTHAVTAELRIHYLQSLLDSGGPVAAADLDAELELYAATVGELLRSRSVVNDALRTDRVKDLGFLKELVSPGEFVREAIEINRRTPSILEVRMLCRGEQIREYQVILNEVVDSCLSRVESSELALLTERKQTLGKIYAKLLEECERERSALESLAAQLGVDEAEHTREVAMDPHLVRGTQRLIDALAEEIAQTKVAMIVDADTEREKRENTLQKLEMEYARQVSQLSEELASRYAQSRPRKFVAIDLKRRDIDRLEKQIDTVAGVIFRTETALESKGRIELISRADFVEL